MNRQRPMRPVAKQALLNGRVILPDEIVTGRAVVVGADKILGLAEPGSIPTDAEIVDVGGRFICPGLIDIHTHGAVGHSFNEPSVEAFTAIAREQALHGVTSILATIATAPVDEMVRCTEVSRQVMEQPEQDGARILGVHLEGPYFSQEQRGAQNPMHMRTPDDDSVDQLLQHQDVIRIFTFAPELPGALALTARLADLGILPAAGHSSARDEHVLAAMKVGLRHTIHIWSSQSTTVREGPWRKPGLLEATLTFDGLTAEMISDNRHLPPTLMKLAYKCLGPDRLCVISDATNGAGLPEGSMFSMGELQFEVCDGVAMTVDRASFAGSTTLLNRMVVVLKDTVGLPLAEVIRMASLTPARVIRLGDRKGSIQGGKDADLAIFNEDFTAWRTMIGGRWVFRQ